ncbi:MAG: prephenate dehydratase [Candidatus Omnitrophica bacterium]|nr:prephenate dehydratase [Candidatus Omnitrophota bacterium]MBU4488469.1 prephenate dehydratase [Candidatus Omnitrophota bacterium]MCG2705352.1 prephenate dehydratase [Candidatus Omnitrophota bacterium]
MNLARLRKKIDKLDERILNLLNGRAKLSLAIGKVKSRQRANIYSPDREREVYRSITSANKGPLSNDSLRAIYGEVMSGCLTLQMPSKIAYLGPSRTFTHIAALKKFGKSLDYLECNSIADVFTEVERGRANYGVVPIENSTEGAVNYTLDMFIDSDLKICSEVYLPIGHKLLSKHKKMSSIKKIYSHEQVFAQCRIWLEKNLPQAKLIPCSSTTAGAMCASAGKGSAAIASKLAAEGYGLNIIAASIEDSPHNITRFLIIGKHEAEPTGSDKTSIVFSMKDKIGVLHDTLAPFKRNRINLTKIESRPSKKRPWEYYFFVDLEGHHEDAKAKRAIWELKKECLYFKILGSYPKAS